MTAKHAFAIAFSIMGIWAAGHEIDGEEWIAPPKTATAQTHASYAHPA